MSKFTTKQGSLFVYYTIQVEQHPKIDRFLKILEKSNVAEIIEQGYKHSDIGRPNINPYKLFATILFGFAFGQSTLRDLESACRYDVRYMYIMDGVKPDHTSFSRFINQVIRPNRNQIFSSIMRAYLEECGISMIDCHIDGTKFEAKPNKYKVVWKPTTFHLKLSDKTRTLLHELNLSDCVPSTGFIPSSLLASKLEEASKLPIPNDPKLQKAHHEKINNLTYYLTKTLEYEEKERICGPNRKSYYKTDLDATAMCLKADYYSGLGTNMHSAYQVQTVVCHGFVVCYYVSQDRADMATFIPTLNQFFKMYRFYPRRITADAGYGNWNNYKFCKDNHIEAFVKYQSWGGESSGRRPALFELLEDGTILCLGGQIGREDQLIQRHHKVAGSNFYKVECDPKCPFMTYCRRFFKKKIDTERIFEINPEYQILKQQARDRLLSPKGIELRVNRSCQVEGVYGILKYDMNYSRLRRIGKESVATEYMLTVLGLNTRKLFRVLEQKTDLTYWVAPPDLQPQKFKKPSAKRISKRIIKEITTRDAALAEKRKKLRNNEGVSL